MTATTDKAIKAEARLVDAIKAIGMSDLPRPHLAIWAECKGRYPDITPAEVWRVLVSDDALSYDHTDGMFRHKETA